MDNYLPPIQIGNAQLEQLADLQSQAGSKLKSFEQNRLEQVGEQFEQIFISMMLKQMRTSMSEEGLFAGDEGDVYGGMFDMFMSEAISSGSQLGIADAIKSYAKNSGSADTETNEGGLADRSDTDSQVKES